MRILAWLRRQIDTRVSERTPRIRPRVEILEDRIMPSLAFFTADDGIHGRELWKSDGTAAGTALVSDINPGSAGSSPQNLFVMNGTLFLYADDGVHGEELWRSDGTAAGTVLVKDINPGAAGSNAQTAALTGMNGTLFFSANDGIHGEELWRTDGTTAGTTLVADITPRSASSNPQNLVALNNTLYFSADGELWKSDGTAKGTVQVKDIYPGGSGSDPYSLTPFNGMLYFGAIDKNGHGLWKSDGTTKGTVRVANVYPLDLKNVNGTLFFVSGALWKSDGTTAGTVVVSNAGFEWRFVVAGGTLLLTHPDGAGGTELWKSNGTAAGAAPVEDINPANSSYLTYSLTTAGNRVFFGVTESPGYQRLWTSDGTAAGTVPLGTVYLPSYGGGPIPFPMAAVGNEVYFTGYASLWKSDGTAAGTVFVSADGAYPQYLTDGSAVRPQIGTFTANPNPAPLGADVTLSAAGVADLYPGATITQVAFYQDSNADGVLEPGTDLLLGYGTQAGASTWILTFSTAGLSAGPDTLFAQAEDSYGAFSDPLAIDLTVI